MGDMEYSFDSVIDCYIIFKDGEVWCMLNLMAY
jgi:hypothetical protein